MEQDTAQRLLSEGGLLIVQDMPLGAEFGIDYNSWNIGPKFRGVKMIPPGVHFIYYSAVDRKQAGSNTGPRSGFFQTFAKEQVVMCAWDAGTETLQRRAVSAEDLDRVRQNIHDLDRFLAPFPFDDTLKTWFSLSQYITPAVVARLQPDNECITSVPESAPLAQTTEPSDIAAACHAAPHAAIKFTAVPRKLFPPNATPQMVTACSLDRSYTLKTLLDTVYAGDFNALLGELQFAFVCFLIGQVFEGFEQWKQLVALLCNCDEALTRHPKLFVDAIAVLHFQLRQTPQDFFVDIVTRSNFLTEALRGLFQRIEHGDVTPELARRAAAFKTSVSKHFDWDFSAADDGDDEQPVIVEDA